MPTPPQPTFPPELACADQIGSVNTTPPDPPIGPYIPKDIPTGDWEISDVSPDQCAQNEQNNQEQYIAESLNISGVPLNVYSLLGVHQQGDGSVLSVGRIITSMSFPGYPATGINNATPWRSLDVGTDVPGSAYVGVDFGIKRIQNGDSEYEPQKQKWTDVGAISITQSNTPGFYAQQVRIEIANGATIHETPVYTGTGDGTLVVNGPGSDATQGILTAVAITPTTFNVYATLPDNTVIGLGTATVGTPFYSIYLNFTITEGPTPFVGGDMFSVVVNYVWARVALFNIIQSPSPQVLNFPTALKVKAVRITPTLFTGANSWEVAALDVLDTPQKNDINVIQDLFLSENRDRDYSPTPIRLKAQYSPTDSTSDLSKFGLSILDQYTFIFSFAQMVHAIGRPIVVGDIIELIPEMQYDQNLLPVRKFLEVMDCGWASTGFNPANKPLTYRVSAQIALPSQETRDIFGTLDTQKYLTPDAILTDGIGEQLNTTPLTALEEIVKGAADAVPEVGSDDIRSVAAVPKRPALPPSNAKGQPAALTNPAPSAHANLYVEAGLPPNGEPYGEGFALPTVPGPSDGDYFRLCYAPETRIAPRLYRFSAVKNRWIFLEQDRRGEYSSHKPSARKILQSNSNAPIDKKLT